MAARYAVTTGNWTGAIWADTSGGAAGSAAVPTNADNVTINKNVTVTVDDTSAVANLVALSVGTTGGDVGGTLTCTTAANWQLAVQGGITASGSTTSAYSSTVNLDMSASAYTGTLIVNNANSGTAAVALAGHCTIKGKAKKRWTTIAATIDNVDDVSATVVDATGWQVGDRLVIASTGAPAWPALTDEIVLTSVDTGTGAIGWSGACANQHLAGAAIGNFSSNLRIKGGADHAVSYFTFRYDSRNRSGTATIRDVEFFRVGGQSSYQAALVVIAGSGSYTSGIFDVSNNAFYDIDGRSIVIVDQSAASTRDGNVFYQRHVSTGISVVYSQLTVAGDVGPDTNYAIFRANGDGNGPAIYAACVGQHQIGANISGLRAQYQNTSAISLASPQLRVEGCKFYGIGGVAVGGNVPFYVYDSDFGAALFASAVNGSDISQGADLAYTERCNFGSADFAGLEPNNPNARITLIDKNGTAGNHEIYGPHSNTAYTVKRVTDTIKGSPSALEFQMTATTPVVVSQPILAKAATALKIKAHVRKSSTYGASTLPYIKLSGLGITPITATMSGGTAADTWEEITLDMSSGVAPSVDGLLTLEMVTQSATSGAKAWVSGLPYAQFVTRCRHYGYLFNETSPTREVNPTIDTGVSEATALAYGNSGTDLEVTWNTAPTPSTTAIKVSTTFKKLYHFTQADGCLNVGSAMPLTGVGLDDAPALFAAGNVTISDGAVLNGAGSISMGAYALATEFASGVNYTYTGGTFSQATTIPSFAGGTLTIDTHITSADSFSMTEGEVVFDEASALWDFQDCTFVGEITLSTTAGQAVTVAINTPSGFTINNTEPGNITVSLPVVTADISITSMPDAGAVPTRLQIINSTATGASAWVANAVYATGAIVKRTTGLGSESTAGLYFRATTGGTSHATTEPTWDTTVGNTTADNTVVWTTYAILYYDDDPAATSLTDTYIDGEEFLDGESVEVRFAEMDGSTSFKTYSTTAVVNSAGFSVLVSEDADDVYATNALDGSDYEATFSPNFTLDYMVLDTNTDFAGKAAFAYYCYTLTTSAGMWGFWGGVTALDEGNYRVNTAILNLYFDESAGFVKQTDNVRIFRDDGLRPAIDPTTGGHGIEINWRTPVNVVTTGGSALTAPESAQLMALPSAIANANAVAAVAVDGATTLAESLALQNSILGGKVSGAGTGTETFRDLADTKDRVVSTVDVDGNRTAVTRTLT